MHRGEKGSPRARFFCQKQNPDRRDGRSTHRFDDATRETLVTRQNQNEASNQSSAHTVSVKSTVSHIMPATEAAGRDSPRSRGRGVRPVGDRAPVRRGLRLRYYLHISYGLLIVISLRLSLSLPLSPNKRVVGGLLLVRACEARSDRSYAPLTLESCSVDLLESHASPPR